MLPLLLCCSFRPAGGMQILVGLETRRGSCPPPGPVAAFRPSRPRVRSPHTSLGNHHPARIPPDGYPETQDRRESCSARCGSNILIAVIDGSAVSLERRAAGQGVGVRSTRYDRLWQSPTITNSHDVQDDILQGLVIVPSSLCIFGHLSPLMVTIPAAPNPCILT
jgi:hypothetical protein